MNRLVQINLLRKTVTSFPRRENRKDFFINILSVRETIDEEAEGEKLNKSIEETVERNFKGSYLLKEFTV